MLLFFLDILDNFYPARTLKNMANTAYSHKGTGFFGIIINLFITKRAAGFFQK